MPPKHCSHSLYPPVSFLLLNSQRSCLGILPLSNPSHSTPGLSEALFILSTSLLTTTEEVIGNLLTEGSKSNNLIGKSQKFQNVTGSWSGSPVCKFYSFLR